MMHAMVLMKEEPEVSFCRSCFGQVSAPFKTCRHPPHALFFASKDGKMALRGVFLVVASVLLTGEERQGTLVSEAFRGFN